MTEVWISCVVEGHGDVAAVPIVVRRIAERLNPAVPVHTPPPIRIPKSRLVKPGELERVVQLAARKIEGRGGVLVLVDSDEQCPGTEGPELLERARAVVPDVELAVVLAKFEFESWFLAAADSLRGRRGLVNTLQAPRDPEAVRGAKEWLGSHMGGAHTYSETLDQPALAALFDLDMARRADSFDELYRDVTRLLGAVPPIP